MQQWLDLTRDYQAILPLMLATVIAHLLATTLGRDSIMTEKLTRRGLHVPSEYHADLLRTTSVRELMTTDVETADADAPIGELARRFQAGGHGAYPVVDGGGRCVGIIARGDLLRNAWPDDSPAAAVSTHDVVSVAPGDTAMDALQRILEEHIEHLPVIDDGRLVGICTRTDIMRARRAQFAGERAEPGWRPRGRGRSDRSAGGPPQDQVTETVPEDA